MFSAVFYLLKAKFHYASWFEAGHRQVRSWSPTSFEPDSLMGFGRGPASSCYRFVASKLDVRPNFSSNQLA